MCSEPQYFGRARDNRHDRNRGSVFCPIPCNTTSSRPILVARENASHNAYLKSNAERANDLSKLIGDYLDYDGAKARTQGLSKKAGFSGS